MCIYERLRRIYVSLKEEENACQVLAAVAVHALSRSFDMAVEKKRGISNLELLSEEIIRAERAKKQKKEMKKLKKKKKKDAKRGINEISCHNCEEQESDVPGLCVCSEMDETEHNHDEDDDDDEIESENIKTSCCNGDHNNHVEDMKDEVSVTSCNSCENIGGGCTKSIDAGYVSEPSSHHDGPCSLLVLSHKNSRTSSIASSPEGSEVACSDGFCNHEQPQFRNSYTPDHSCSRENRRDCMTLTLQQMLVSLRFYSDSIVEGKIFVLLFKNKKKK